MDWTMTLMAVWMIVMDGIMSTKTIVRTGRAVVLEPPWRVFVQPTPM